MVVIVWKENEFSASRGIRVLKYGFQVSTFKSPKNQNKFIIIIGKNGAEDGLWITLYIRCRCAYTIGYSQLWYVVYKMYVCYTNPLVVITPIHVLQYNVCMHRRVKATRVPSIRPLHRCTNYSKHPLTGVKYII